MMYVNKLTGASFESECECRGGNWEKASKKSARAAKSKEEPKEKPKRAKK